MANKANLNPKTTRVANILSLFMFIGVVGIYEYNAYKRETKYIAVHHSQMAQQKRQKYDEMNRILRTDSDREFQNFFSSLTPDEKNKQPILGQAAYYGRTSLVKWLLDQHWNANKSSQSSQLDGSPLAHAASKKSADMIALLLERGADANLTTQNRTPLHWASQLGSVRAIKLLLDAKARINATVKDEMNFTGFTPLMLASFYGHTDAVRLLINHNSDTKYKSQHGDTALDLAIQHNHKEIVQLLEAHAKKISSKSR